MKIEITYNELEDGFVKPTAASTLGLVRNRRGDVFLIHGMGITRLNPDNVFSPTSTHRFGDFDETVKPFPSGTVIKFTI